MSTAAPLDVVVALPPRDMPDVMPDGSFRNPWPSFVPPSLWRGIKWKVCGDTKAPPFPTKEEACRRLPSTAPNLAVLHQYEALHGSDADGNDIGGSVCDRWFAATGMGRDGRGAGGIAVTWCSHSAFVVQSGGFSILTDPVWSDRASPVSFAGPKRMVPTPIPLADLPTIDVVTISHNHYDHLDTAAVVDLAQRFQPIFVVPLGMKRWFRSLGASVGVDLDRVVELNWWDEVTIAFRDGDSPVGVPAAPTLRSDAHDPAASGGRICRQFKRTCVVVEAPHPMPSTPVDSLDLQPLGHRHALCRITATPAQHWSARNGMDRFQELWVGFVVRISMRIVASTPLHEQHCGARGDSPHGVTEERIVTRSVFHSGDTGYCSTFASIGEHFSATGSCTQPQATPRRKFGVDVGLIAIGAYSPRNVMSAQHVNPEEAVRIHDDVRIKYSIGMHWGTFILTDEPIDEPPQALAAAMDARWKLKTACGGSADLGGHERRKRDCGREFVALKHGETSVFDASMLDDD